MAELVLSALLPVLFEKLASLALKTIARYKGIDAEIKKWHRSLTQIQDLLNDASKKEINSHSVKRWLNELHHLAYDIDDVLDDLAIEAMDREFNNDSEAITSKVRKLIPSCCTNFSRSTKTLHKLDSITAKLKDLVEEKDILGLRVEEESKPKNVNRKLQTSMVHASSIVGRQAEKEALAQQLLLDEPCDQNFSVVPIVGMGGVGKTTLARLLYDDEEVKGHFEFKAWVCVSDEFDSFGISKVIFQSVVGANKEFADLNLLQVDLVNHLRGKRFLLVLDDVWSESYEDWKILVGPFHACASGSKIIITTRKKQLLKKLGYNHPNQLESLSHDDALSLFAMHALGVDKFDSHLSLKPLGEGIVKKCDKLPLALIALGTSLRTKEDEDSWREVFESEIWTSKDDVIVPALRLSYYDLSARLKQLFAYCSLFPKDFLFDKEELVLLWMAEGFLHESTPSNSTEEHLGHEYFDELLSRSFFQHAPNNESFFMMHDLMNDLATYVSSEFFVRLDNESEKKSRKEMLDKYRHMSFVRDEYVAYKKFEEFTRAKSLRTLLATSAGVEDSWEDFYISNKILVDLLPELPLLRVLCLSDFQISEAPESIGNLRHLRYLNLSRTRITSLPESVCNLYNLQTLIVYGCRRLTKLPNNFSKLKNMRHLDIKDTLLLNHMPLGVGELRSLQTLSKIIIGGENGFKINKLKDLKKLAGKLSIVGLDKVQDAIHAREANFSQKRLSVLKVVWSNEQYGSRNGILEKEVLNEMKPCDKHLKQLEIVYYGGLDFPNWVGNSSFLYLKRVSICYCKRCTLLPPLGQLPSLKELVIKGLDGVGVVGMELLGTSCAFSSLEFLSLGYMNGLTEWSTTIGGIVFPSLKKLLIEACPNLAEVTLEALPSLNELTLNTCDSSVLRRLVQVASAVTKLNIYNISRLNDVVWRDILEYLGAVEDLNIIYCNEIKYLWDSEATANKFLVKLRNMTVSNCDNIVNLGEKVEEDSCRKNLLPSLRLLDVSCCKNMEGCSCPYSIEVLRLGFCDSITTISIPTGGQKLKSVNIYGCNNLLEREWGGQKMNINNGSNLSMLECLRISDWPNLKSIIKSNYLVHLTTLSITRCESLESFPNNELSDFTSLTYLGITNCPKLDVSFPSGVWPPKLHSLSIGNLKKPILEWGPQNFPTTLVNLSLCDEDGVTSCSQFSHLLPLSLTSLYINSFEKLESLSVGLQNLTSLQDLYFSNCPNLNRLSLPQHLTSLQHLSFYECANMMDLPEMTLPSLLRLKIFCCPKLKERCSKDGCYWPLIRHIPRINIYPEP